MNTSTSCTHHHHVKVGLGEGDQFILPPRWKGGRPVLVTTVTAQATPEGTVTSVSLHGRYAKKDGTASATRLSYPERSSLDELPQAIRDAVVTAVSGARHALEVADHG